MGEIVDLEDYRRQRKRRSLDSETAGNRRQRNRNKPKGERSQPTIDPVEPGRAELGRAGEIDRDDQTAD